MKEIKKKEKFPSERAREILRKELGMTSKGKDTLDFKFGKKSKSILGDL